MTRPQRIGSESAHEPDFPLESRNYTAFVGERPGYDYEDVSKKYKIWGRQGHIDDIIDHAQPVLEKNGVAEEKARELANAVFLRDDLMA